MNGDFVDRGSYSVEIIITLMAWRLHNPECMYLTRGNHEAKSLNMIYGFKGEVEAKYCGRTYNIFCDVFNTLPLCFSINSKVFVTHGGLFSKDGVTVKDILALDRFHEPPNVGIMCELLWSDPIKQNGR